MDQDRVISLGMLARFGKALWRHLWLIGGIVALVVIAAYFLQSRTPAPYAAESWLLVKTPPYNPGSDQVTPYGGSLDSMVNLLASVAVESRVLANPQSEKLPAE